MIEKEKLEDILHREKLAELDREIDELPDLHGEINEEINKEALNLYSPDSLIGNPFAMIKMNKTDWRRKYAKPNADLEILRAKRNTLESLRNSYIALGIIQTLVVFIVLWWISASY